MHFCSSDLTNLDPFTFIHNTIKSTRTLINSDYRWYIVKYLWNEIAQFLKDFIPLNGKFYRSIL